MNSLVNNEKQSHCIYHLTNNTHIKGKKKKYIQNTTKKKHSHSRCKFVCKTRSKTTTKQNRQPELHQLTKQKYYPTEKKNKLLKMEKKQQRLSKLCFNQQKQKS